MKGFHIDIKNGKVDYQLHVKENAFDNYIVDKDDILIVIEGVILNKSSLQKNLTSTNEYLHQLYNTYGKNIIEQLEGEIVGFILDRPKRKLYTFTNFTATRKLFYFQENGRTIIETSLIRLVDILKREKIKYTLDEFSMYSILVFGNMMENHTPIEEVKKLCDAEFLEVNIDQSLGFITSYHTPLADYKGNKKDAINTIENLFTEATTLEFQKDKELQKETFALLSGGLDSRMTVLTALENNFSIDEVFCFSQKGYWDEAIARHIAKDYQLPFHFVPLNSGDYLNEVENIFKISEGLVIFSGALHTNYAYQFIDKNRFGLIHSGQLGDGVLGSFNRHPYRHIPTKEKVVSFPNLFPRIENQFNEILSKYDREEIFLTRNVGYNRTVLGSYLAETISYQTSPFMYSPLIKFVQSLPEKWKYNQAIYIEWLNQYHKNASKYRWERTLLYPKSNVHTILGDKLVKRSYNVFFNKILRLHHRCNMVAYEYYYQRNPQLITSMLDYFETWIDHVSSPQLKQDLTTQFEKGDFMEKTGVLSVLCIVKNYFTI